MPEPTTDDLEPDGVIGQPHVPVTFHVDPTTFGRGLRLGRGRDEIVIIDDNSRRMRLWNKGAKHTYGYVSEDAIGQDVVTLIPKRLAAQHNADSSNYRSTGHCTLVDFQTALEVNGLTRDGEVPIEVSLASVACSITGGRR